MRKLILCFFSVCAVLAVSPGHAYIDHTMAVVRVMNKAAGKAHTVKLPVGRVASFEKLDLLVQTCKQSDPFQAEDYFMFIEISQGSKIFSGWMTRNEPGNNPLQHPDYDLWVVGCE